MYPSFRFALLLFVVIVPLTLSAQTNFPLTNAENKTLLSFQFQHPFFKSGSTDFSLLSGTYDLTLVAPVGSGLSIIGTLPYAAYATSSSFSDNSMGTFTNISVGLRKTFVPSTSLLDFKVFLPTAPSDSKNTYAMYYAFYHRLYDFELYIPDAFSFQTRYYYFKNFDGLLLGGVIGASAFVPTDNGNDEIEVFIRYGVSTGYENKDIRLLAEITGIGILTEKKIFSDGKTEYYAVLGGQWTGGSVIKPKINVHIPLGNDLSEIYGTALTLGCDFVLP